MSTVITLNTYLQSLPSHHQCRGYIHTYMCVHDSETDDCGTVWGGNIHKIIILMEVKSQEQVLKLFSACALFLFEEMNKIQDLSIRSAATWFWPYPVACKIL